MQADTEHKLEAETEHKFGALFVMGYVAIVAAILLTAGYYAQGELKPKVQYCETLSIQCEGHDHDGDPVLSSMAGPERICPCADHWYCKGVFAADGLAGTVSASMFLR